MRTKYRNSVKKTIYKLSPLLRKNLKEKKGKLVKKTQNEKNMEKSSSLMAILHMYAGAYLD